MEIPYQLSYENYNFPDPSLALNAPNGLLAIGGDLSTERLLSAYQNGIFPWYSEGQPILWWSPDPRTILIPTDFKISRSLKKLLRQKKFTVSYDTAFSQVIHACAQPRNNEPETWILAEMQSAYIALNQQGIAHSVEVWAGETLVGGLYGVSLGKVFFGESMFSQVANTSKIALAYLCAQLISWQFSLIDCQMATTHLSSLGAAEFPRKEFIKLVKHYTQISPLTDSWPHTPTIEPLAILN